MSRIILSIIFLLTFTNVNSKPHRCSELARNADWYNILIECQDMLDDPIATYTLAYMYQKGIYVSRDNAKSRKWYQLAELNGSLQAKVNLAIMEIQGHGTGIPDLNKGMILIKEAAMLGHPIAQIILYKINTFNLTRPKGFIPQAEDYFLIVNTE